MEAEVLICARCDREMELTDVTLTYLGHQLTNKFPVCPVCKLVYISEEAATGKMQLVERELEDK